MARTEAELTQGIDDDFRNVVKEMTEFFVAGARKLQGRATHTTGTAARGFARIVTPPDFPMNDFLQFGKQYPVLVRHATPRPAMGGNTDDRTLDGGSIAIKFQALDATGLDGFHDVLMNTGRIMFVPSARAFNTMIHTPMNARGPLIENGDLNDDNLTEAYRTGSYTEFYYHSQIVFEFIDNAKTLHYIRYRVIPGDRGPERGLFPPSVRSNGATFAEKWPDDTRSEKFRREDFAVRVRHLGVDYLLQAQIRPGGDTEALNPMVYWDERNFPWIDLAQIHLSDMINEEDMDLLQFNANNTHESINLPLAIGADDHASLGHARALIYWHAQQARAASPKPHLV